MGFRTQKVYDNGRCIGQLCIPDDVALDSDGLQTWSTTPKRHVILSAYLADRDNAENEIMHYALGKELRTAGLTIGEVTGCYKGQEELAYLVRLESADDWPLVLTLAKCHGQESVLLIHTDRKAELCYIWRGVTESVGKLIAINPLQARRVENWTRTKNGQYYTTTGAS